MVDMVYVYSSIVVRWGYDQERREFHVHYGPTVNHPAGRTAVYSDVAPDLAADIMAAPSPGQAVRNNLRNIKPFRYL